MAESSHHIRFPNETPAYRAARNELLQAEVELRRRVEEVAALRWRLPAGGEVREDYAFEEAAPGGKIRTVRMSELFAPGKVTLILYSFMYGAEMKSACPMCSSFLDALDRTAQHATQRVNLAAVAKSPVDRILRHAADRGWNALRLLSSHGSSYNQDYYGEDASGNQLPSLNVFVQRDGKLHHFYNTEPYFVSSEPGQDPRHIDMMWPLWNLLDLTPEGRGSGWRPKLKY